MKRSVKEYIGNPDQILELKTMRLEGGMEQSVLASEVQCQSGMSLTVLADRCMDISVLRYRGINISYINPCGVVAPCYYDKRSTQWLRSFTGGFLTTCGLDNTGSPCEENGTEYGLHGRISNMPAREYSAQRIEQNGEYMAVLCGEMDQSSLFGEKLKLKRKIQVWNTQPRFEVTDEICNTGFREEEFMILYHCNIGYPFLSPESKVMIDSSEFRSRSSFAEKYKSHALEVSEPNELDEMCYYHKMRDHNGKSRAGVYQPEYGFGLVMTYENTALRRFTQWKNFSKGQYVLGLEPGTNWVEGKAVERTRDEIQKLEGQSSIRYSICVDIVNGYKKFLEYMEEK